MPRYTRLGKSLSLLLLPLAVVALVSFEALAQPFSEQAELFAGDPSPGDSFGYGVAISGDTAVVGANLDDPPGDSGSAYVFERQNGDWVQVKKLIASDAAAGDNFGYSVAISGATIVVGAYANNGLHGAAYIFERDAGGPNQWGQVKRLAVSVFALFGADVSISNDTVLVAAPGETSGGEVSNDGTAYIFRRDQGGANNWGQVKRLTSGGAAAGGNFGVSVSISGDTALVGAWLEDPGAVNDAGAAYIFRRDQGGSSNWGQQQKLTASDGSSSDHFGVAVSIRGAEAIVGASNDGFGSAYVFERDQAGVWSEARKLTASDSAEGDQFGSSVSTESGTAVVGAPGDDVGAGSNDEGSAHVFLRNQGGPDNWGHVEKLTVGALPASDVHFGADIALGGGTAVIAAPLQDHHSLLNPGAAYVFVAAPSVPSLSPAAAALTACLVLASAFALRRTV